MQEGFSSQPNDSRLEIFNNNKKPKFKTNAGIQYILDLALFPTC